MKILLHLWMVLFRICYVLLSEQHTKLKIQNEAHTVIACCIRPLGSVNWTYRFVAEDNELYGDVLFFEITYPADEAGRPSAGGMETFKRYLIGYERYGYGSARWQMELLNLRSFPLATKAVEAPEYKYYVTMRFVDVTDIEDLVITERFDSDHFKAESAQLLPWNF